MEAKVMLLGIYRSFEELEDNLTMEEMILILDAEHKREQKLFKVLAAVNGVPWDDGSGGESAEDAVERAKREAQAELEGKSSEQIELESLGIKFE